MRTMIRAIERFAVLEVYGAGEDDLPRAQTIMRLAVGLRRKLDQIKEA
jgi:hypothetical protein